jgi:hypothetical protein
MANFNLNDYELVETRIRKFYSLYEDGRIITENVSTPEDRAKNMFVTKTSVYTSLAEHAANLPKATGHAFEIEGGMGAAKFSSLEVCETSSIGRALANMSLSGNKRASREEMEKVQRMESKPDAWEKPLINWAEEIANLEHADGARGLYALAKAENAPKAVLEAIETKGKSLTEIEPVKNEKS